MRLFRCVIYYQYKRLQTEAFQKQLLIRELDKVLLERMNAIDPVTFVEALCYRNDMRNECIFEPVNVKVRKHTEKERLNI
jgi:hypothetical protein